MQAEQVDLVIHAEGHQDAGIGVRGGGVSRGGGLTRHVAFLQRGWLLDEPVKVRLALGQAVAEHHSLQRVCWFGGDISWGLWAAGHLSG